MECYWTVNIILTDMECNLNHFVCELQNQGKEVTSKVDPDTVHLKTVILLLFVHCYCDCHFVSFLVLQPSVCFILIVFLLMSR